MMLNTYVTKSCDLVIVQNIQTNIMCYTSHFENKDKVWLDTLKPANEVCKWLKVWKGFDVGPWETKSCDFVWVQKIWT